MKLTLLIAFLILGINFTFSQEYGQLSGGLESNSQYYVDDSKLGDFPEDNHFRSNSYLRLNYTYKNWFANIQGESYEPQALLNYYPKHEGTNVGTFAIGYKSEKLEATLGYFYEQFGSGLALRAWEDRQLGINNAIRGAKIKYSPTNFLEFTGLYGRQRDGFEVSRAEIFAFNSEIGLSDIMDFEESIIGIGLSYVGRLEKLDIDSPNYNDLTSVISGRLDYSEGSFYSSFEYVYKTEDVYEEQGRLFTNRYFSGNALLVNLGYAKSGLGIDATFRRMENMAFYSQRDQASNIYNQNIINYLPALTKQYDYSLANIYVYQSQPKLTFNPQNKSGEIGGQIDVYYTFKKETTLGGKYGTKIALNFSNWYGLKGDFNTLERKYQPDGYLGFGENYYRDLGLEVRKKLSKDWSTIFTVINTEYNQKYIEDRIGVVNATTIAAEATHKLGNGKSYRVELQHLFSDDHTENRADNWAAGTVEYNFNSKFAIYAMDMWNYGNPNDGYDIHYYNFGGSFTKGATRIGASYGRQRGGLVCVGGICRYVPENTGFTLNIATAF